MNIREQIDGMIGVKCMKLAEAAHAPVKDIATARAKLVSDWVGMVKRIPLARERDTALINVLMRKKSIRAAKSWSTYLEEEIGHEEFFAKDLQKIAGLSREDIDKMPTSRRVLMEHAYVLYLTQQGDSLIRLCQSYINECGGKLFAAALPELEKRCDVALTGARAHSAYDDGHDHLGDVWRVFESEIETEEDGPQRALQHCDDLLNLFPFD